LYPRTSSYYDLTQLHSLKEFNENNTKGEQVKVNLSLEDETEKERPRLPLTFLIFENIFLSYLATDHN
jgi:hypothetical protein